MYVLDYLADPKCEKKPKDSLTSEYRLLCSGTIYRNVVGSDPYKSEAARILLNDPLRLFAVTRPLSDYPLEVALEVTVPQVQEKEEVKTGASILLFHPDDEVVRDLAALLSLLCRRLITVSGKASERHADYPHPLYQQRPVPMPLATTMRRVAWRPHPISVLYSIQGQEYQDYNPRPKAVNPCQLTEMLIALPQIDLASSIVTACRLYALALELIHERPDISYQLLISSVETMANTTLDTFQPDDDAKLQHKKPVYDLAISLKLDETTARRLAIEACKGEYWATRKFKTFLIDNVAESIWTEDDELFHQMSNALLPKRENFEKTLGRICQARSKATHVGESFPLSASYTGGPSINTRVASTLFGTDEPFPPVVWFERIVHSAVSGFWDKSLKRNPS